ncbi:hypothetical protein JQK87_16745 [Streptomyces sp. G44]|uniref:hypothetical protein n=1 Tax=Streptomyces sp. G44 TaxID=2807632 RepID=UPI0019620854|nr:hypothetical protein [Streptomyces sp. G44]MBM7170037.1 hypothetical protein [Streptomyces sp. G44]
MMLLSWITLTGVERFPYKASWPGALTQGLLWACVVAGTWWFAEMTQGHALRAGTTRGDTRVNTRR